MKQEIKKWLTSAFLLLALTAGALAGTPLHSGGMNHPVTDCCRKAKSKEQTNEASLARLCCALNCTARSEPASPVEPFNFSPVSVVVSGAPVKQVFPRFFSSEKAIRVSARSLEREILARHFTPLYITQHSFLI